MSSDQRWTDRASSLAKALRRAKRLTSTLCQTVVCARGRSLKGRRLTKTSSRASPARLLRPRRRQASLPRNSVAQLCAQEIVAGSPQARLFLRRGGPFFVKASCRALRSKTSYFQANRSSSPPRRFKLVDVQVGQVCL